MLASSIVKVRNRHVTTTYCSGVYLQTALLAHGTFNIGLSKKRLDHMGFPEFWKILSIFK
jgi:hypothetical protein